MHIIIEMLNGEVIRTTLTLLTETAQAKVKSYAEAINHFAHKAPDKFGDACVIEWDEFYELVKDTIAFTGHELLWFQNVTPIDNE